jgi:glycosyltransferase involved in cell wall biosynthesis
MIRVLYIVNQIKGYGSIRSQVDNLRNNLDNTPGYQGDIYSTKGNIFKRIWLFFYLFFRGKRFDIFHIHGCSYRGFLPIVYGVTAGMILRKKIIITYHGGDAFNFLKNRPYLTHFFLGKANHLIVMSGYLQSVFQKFGYDVQIIPNIIVNDEVRYTFRDQLRPLFISTRSIEPLYNLKLILDAFKKIQQKYIEASLVIMGNGSLKEWLIDYVKLESIDNVHFPGHVSNESIFDYLAKSDILINAPLTDNMPVSLLEAFSAGLLVISSNVGGIPYMIEHQKNGLLFESGNLNDLVDKIELALVDQDLSKQMVINAFNEMEKYRWESVKKNIFELYS